MPNGLCFTGFPLWNRWESGHPIHHCTSTIKGSTQMAWAKANKSRCPSRYVCGLGHWWRRRQYMAMYMLCPCFIHQIGQQPLNPTFQYCVLTRRSMKWTNHVTMGHRGRADSSYSLIAPGVAQSPSTDLTPYPLASPMSIQAAGDLFMRECSFSAQMSQWGGVGSELLFIVQLWLFEPPGYHLPMGCE